MKILVVEDKEENRILAAEQLIGHELTFANDFSGAMVALKTNNSISQKPTKAPFDMVLSDMNMPFGNSSIRGQLFLYDEFLGMEAPYGATICLVALAQKVPQVAIVSAGDRHRDLATASLALARLVINWQDEYGNDVGYKAIQFINKKDFGYAFRQLQESAD